MQRNERINKPLLGDSAESQLPAMVMRNHAIIVYTITRYNENVIRTGIIIVMSLPTIAILLLQ